MLDLATTERGQSIANNSIVHVEQRHGRLIAYRLGQGGRFDDVREENGADSRISRIGCATRNDGCSRLVHFPAAEKSFRELGLYLNDFFGNKAVGFAMYLACRLRVWRMDEAEDLAAILVHPVLAIFNAIFALCLQISRMSFCDVLRSHPVKVVNVHV